MGANTSFEYNLTRYINKRIENCIPKTYEKNNTTFTISLVNMSYEFTSNRNKIQLGYSESLQWKTYIEVSTREEIRRKFDKEANVSAEYYEKKDYGKFRGEFIVKINLI